MTDDPPHNANQPDPDGGGGEVISEEDLDDLLAEASDLASEIADDVGVGLTETAAASQPTVDEPVENHSTEADPSALSPESEPGSIESQLDTLEQRLDEARDEIGAPEMQNQHAEPIPDHSGQLPAATEMMTAPESPTEPATEVTSSEAVRQSGSPATRTEGLPEQPPDKTPAVAAGEVGGEAIGQTGLEDSTTPPDSAPSEADIPDFMSELTESSEEAATVPRDRMDDLSTPGHSEPGAKTSSTSPAQPSTMMATPKKPQPDSRTVPNTEASTDENGQTGLLGRVQSLGARVGVGLSPVAYRLSEKGVDVLETLDRPVQWLGDGPRCLLGWFALATMGTALLVFVGSLF